MKLRIGCRDSALSIAQAVLVVDGIHRYDPTIETELVTMKTMGDKILDKPLDKIGGRGLFVRELDAALRAGQVDLTVHSCKDLPLDLPEDLPIAAYTRREDPRDVLVLPLGAAALDRARPIGSSSPRRRLALGRLYPDMAVEPVRGNVQTRLRKLDGGRFSALVLAAAGLRRLGLAERIGYTFSPEEMLPAAGQGILAVQVRAGTDTSFLALAADPDAAACARAERAFMREMGGGCASPAAAYGTVGGGELSLTGIDAAGRRDTIAGPLDQAEELGRALAKRLGRGEGEP